MAFLPNAPKGRTFSMLNFNKNMCTFNEIVFPREYNSDGIHLIKLHVHLIWSSDGVVGVIYFITVSRINLKFM